MSRLFDSVYVQSLRLINTLAKLPWSVLVASWHAMFKSYSAWIYYSFYSLLLYNSYLYSTYRYRHMIHKKCHCFDWQIEYTVDSWYCKYVFGICVLINFLFIPFILYFWSSFELTYDGWQTTPVAHWIHPYVQGVWKGKLSKTGFFFNQAGFGFQI